MHWPKGQKVNVQGHAVTKTVTFARLQVTRVFGRVLPLPAWVCMSIRLHMFSSSIVNMYEWMAANYPRRQLLPAWLRRSIASVCLSVCPLSKLETAWAINTKLGTRRIRYSSRSACTYPQTQDRSKGQRSRSHGYKNRQKHYFCLFFACPRSKRKRLGTGMFYGYREIV